MACDLYFSCCLDMLSNESRGSGVKHKNLLQNKMKRPELPILRDYEAAFSSI